jgi:hypothetical protein
MMENFLRDGTVDLRGISNRAIAGDAHFFDDSTSPEKIHSFLESSKVKLARIMLFKIQI